MFLALAWLVPSAVLFADEPAKVKVDLPGFEQGDLYVLGRLSNEELLKMEHSEWVWVAILIREGIDRHHRTEAITKLAQIWKSDEPEQILAGMTRAAKAAGESPGGVYELARLPSWGAAAGSGGGRGFVPPGGAGGAASRAAGATARG